MCAGCSSGDLGDRVSNIKDSGNKYVQMVKGGYRMDASDDAPDATYEKAFEYFFSSPTWKYIKGETGEDVVEFTGGCVYHGANVKVRLQFIVDEENGTFEAGAMTFNDVPQNRLITLTLIEKAFNGYSGYEDD